MGGLPWAVMAAVAAFTAPPASLILGEIAAVEGGAWALNAEAVVQPRVVVVVGAGVTMMPLGGHGRGGEHRVSFGGGYGTGIPYRAILLPD